MFVYMLAPGRRNPEDLTSNLESAQQSDLEPDSDAGLDSETKLKVYKINCSI